MLLLTPLALLLSFSVTQAAVIDAPELTSILDDRLSITPVGCITPADTLNLNARSADHFDCEYSGIVPGVWVTGVKPPTPSFSVPTILRILPFSFKGKSAPSLRNHANLSILRNAKPASTTQIAAQQAL